MPVTAIIEGYQGAAPEPNVYKHVAVCSHHHPSPTAAPTAATPERPQRPTPAAPRRRQSPPTRRPHRALPTAQRYRSPPSWASRCCRRHGNGTANGTRNGTRKCPSCGRLKAVNDTDYGTHCNTKHGTPFINNNNIKILRCGGEGVRTRPQRTMRTHTTRTRLRATRYALRARFASAPRNCQQLTADQIPVSSSSWGRVYKSGVNV